MGHSQEGLLACGGFADSTKGWGTCDRFDTGSGGWVQAYNLTNRWSHVSWATEDGIYLIGGGYGARTSDLLKTDGTVVAGFRLQTDMQGHCGISVEDGIILTGGTYRTDPKSVAKYDRNGFVSNEPSLIEGRSGHGCSKYVNNDNKIVFLVTGGYGGSFQTRLDSTEVLVNDESSWRTTGKLPLAVYGISAISLNNEVYAMGGYFDVNNKDQDFILKYDTNTDAWAEVGKMKVSRTSLGISVISVADVLQYTTSCEIN